MKKAKKVRLSLTCKPPVARVGRGIAYYACTLTTQSATHRSLVFRLPHGFSCNSEIARSLCPQLRRLLGTSENSCLFFRIISSGFSDIILLRLNSSTIFCCCCCNMTFINHVVLNYINKCAGYATCKHTYTRTHIHKHLNTQ